MIITHHGAACFKVQFGDITLAFNPISKDSVTYKPVRFGADIALMSFNHPDANGVSQVMHGGKEPFVIRGPGEYEVGGVMIRGFLSRTEYGGEQRTNTIYLVELEGMTICFLSALNTKELPHDAWEAIDEIDLLFVPIAGGGSLDATNAYKLAVSLEPRMIVPMLFDGDGQLNTFLQEGGVEGRTPEEKLTVKQKDVAGKEGEIAVLKAQ